MLLDFEQNLSACALAMSNSTLRKWVSHLCSKEFVIGVQTEVQSRLNLKQGKPELCREQYERQRNLCIALQESVASHCKSAFLEEQKRCFAEK